MELYVTVLKKKRFTDSYYSKIELFVPQHQQLNKNEQKRIKCPINLAIKGKHCEVTAISVYLVLSSAKC